MKIFRYGTRGSALALAQSSTVARALAVAGGANVERVVITTSGDRFARNDSGAAAPAPSTGREPSSLRDSANPASAQPAFTELASAAKRPEQAPNVKAMFVKEIEDALLDGRIDFAVHSAKDLPADIPEGLVLGAVPAREDPRDAFIPAPRTASFAALKKGGLIATGSLRRRIQLALARPDLLFAPIRGNVDTRLGRLDREEFDGMVLAVAGLRRLGLSSRRHEPLPEDLVVPAPGQGALAVEVRADRADVLELLRGLDDPQSRLELEAERAFLAAVGGGCLTPLGCLARVEGAGIKISAFWSEADGSKPRRLGTDGAAADGPELAKRLADRLLRG